MKTMIRITVYQDQEGRYRGFDCSGHADYAESGSDIVCAGVSALVITAVNAVGELTDEKFTSESDQEEGSIRFRMRSFGHDSQLLLQAMVLGLEEMENSYGKWIDLIFEEV